MSSSNDLPEGGQMESGWEEVKLTKRSKKKLLNVDIGKYTGV